MSLVEAVEPRICLGDDGQLQQREPSMAGKVADVFFGRVITAPSALKGVVLPCVLAAVAAVAAVVFAVMLASPAAIIAGVTVVGVGAGAMIGAGVWYALQKKLNEEGVGARETLLEDAVDRVFHDLYRNYSETPLWQNHLKQFYGQGCRMPWLVSVLDRYANHLSEGDEGVGAFLQSRVPALRILDHSRAEWSGSTPLMSEQGA